MDAMVLKTQQWLNSTYGNDSRYERIPESGETGWNTIYALTRALQIELGIQSTADNFGPTTIRLFNERFPNGIAQQQDTDTTQSNIYAIIQGSLWCKGYSTGTNVITKNFYSGTGSAIKELKSDAGYLTQTSVVTLNIMKALLSMDAFVLIDGGTELIRSVQKYLNRHYEPYIGVIPCDGVYGRNTNTALIYALQAEEGLSTDVANGYFGPTTRSKCPVLPDTENLISQVRETSFINLLQSTLICNGFRSMATNGIYDSATMQQIKNFQQQYALPVTGVTNLDTWMSLMVSCGNINRVARACDCVTNITSSRAQTLKSNGYICVGRYLTGTYGGGISKAITRAEAQIIFNAGLKFFPIYQDGGDDVSYFTERQGNIDAYKAYSVARQLGIPDKAIIYFAVDFDAMDYQITQKVIPYFHGVYTSMTRWDKYQVGVYGARNTCSRVCEQGYACSSFVADMSTGFSGNLGFTLPDNWAFDQFTTITIGSGNGQIEIDKNAYSGRNVGISYLNAEKTVDIAALKQMDINALSNTYYYRANYNAFQTDLAEEKLPDNIADYNILTCLQALYVYYRDREDYEKTDFLFDEMIRLRKLHPQYRSIYASVIDANGNFNFGYEYYAKDRKTTKITFEQAAYFTKETIIQMHQADDWLAFMANLIPGIGSYLSTLLSLMNTIEQNGEIGVVDLLKDEIYNKPIENLIEELVQLWKDPPYVKTALDTFYRFVNTLYGTKSEGRETYIKDGVTIQDGDSFICVRLHYDMGVEYHQFRFYFRNALPYATGLPSQIVRWDDDIRGQGVVTENVDKFTKEGYVPSEVHYPRGSYWPL